SQAVLQHEAERHGRGSTALALRHETATIFRELPPNKLKIHVGFQGVLSPLLANLRSTCYRVSYHFRITCQGGAHVSGYHKRNPEPFPTHKLRRVDRPTTAIQDGV